MNKQEFITKYTHESTVAGYTEFKEALEIVIDQETTKKRVFYNTVNRPVICAECTTRVKNFKYSSKLTYCPLCNQTGMF